MDRQEVVTERQDDRIIGNNIDQPVEESVPHVCNCGNPGHVNLSEWIEIAPNDTSYRIALESDALDLVMVAREIEKAQEIVQIVDTKCSSCRNLLEDLPDILTNKPPTEDNAVVRPHFQNLAEFKAALNQGCCLCRLLDQCHQREYGTMNLDEFHKIESRLRCLGKPTTICLLIESDWGDNNALRVSLNMPGLFENWGFPILGSMAITPSEVVELEPTPAPGSDRIAAQLRIATQWLAECLGSHNHCAQNPTSFFPSRLIYVRGESLRLVVTSALDHRPKYSTLSHCWGKIPYIKLETILVDSMMKNIPEDDLTQTFRDAIKITRALNIDYIWIDSLCIIQDSPSDWQAEAIRMESVYSGGTINIAATGAADGRQGCFLQPQDYIGKVPVKNVTSTTEKCWVISNHPDSIPNMPLSRRAWTIQERLLSTRTLHFSLSELVWECKTGDAREEFPQIIEREREETSLASTWDRIVGQYTRAALTKPSDKLIAIGGIARAAQLESGSRYLAGLWETDIEGQLLWLRAGSNRNHYPKSGAYRAPTWSWASVDGSVIPHRHKDYLTHAHVISASVTPQVGDDPFGQVRAGTIRLACKALLSGSIHKVPGRLKDWAVISSDGTELLSRVFPDYDIDGNTVFLVLIADSGPKIDDQSIEGRWPEGLMLQPSGVKHGQYLRAGVWSIRDTRGSQKFQGEMEYTKIGTREVHDAQVKSLLTLFGAVGTETAGANCAEILTEPEHQDERYIIEII